MPNISKLPDAQDIADGICSRINPKNELIKTALLGFAKLHVEAALKNCLDKYHHSMQEDYTFGSSEIMNSYPLTNIK